MEARIVKNRSAQLTDDDFDAVAEIRSRYAPAPRDFLRVVSISRDEKATSPVLVCDRCFSWHKHERALDEYVLSDGGQAIAIKEMWSCSACGLKRAWGRKSVDGGIRCLN